MSPKQAILIGAAVAVAGYLAAGLVQPAPGTTGLKRTFGPPALATQLSNPLINESSGVARSHRYPGWYYTHNDSGDQPRFWRFDLKGNVVGPISVLGAQAFDWEDVASARLGGRNFLYFADIGDNARVRKSVFVYRVEEPAPGATSVPCDVFELTYPDGAHNAEAFVVHPSTGDFAIVEKLDASTPRVYWASAPKPGSQALQVLGSLQFSFGPGESRLVTGADFSPDGRFVCVRTYQAGYEFELGSSLSSWCTVDPTRVPLATEVQGEAIGYSSTGDRLVTTSEFAPCRVSQIAIVENGQ